MWTREQNRVAFHTKRVGGGIVFSSRGHVVVLSHHWGVLEKQGNNGEDQEPETGTGTGTGCRCRHRGFVGMR